MNDKKKRILLISNLACLVLCAVFLLTGCIGSKNPVETTDPTVETTTEPDGAAVQEETTEPISQETTEKTTEETTEEPTLPPSSGGSGINNGTGGSYTPQTSQPAGNTTEPDENATEPEIEVPEAGSRENPYYESIAAPGSFTTVKIPANGTVDYAVKTAGTFLKIQSGDVEVIFNGEICKPENGVLELTLPGNQEPVKTPLRFVNKGSQAQFFTVEIMEAPGTKSNPIVVTDITALQVKLEQDDADGLYYTWTADKSGVLNVGLSSVKPAGAGVEVVVTVGDKTGKLSQSHKGILQIPVNEQDTVTVQIVALPDADGGYPAIEAEINSTILPVKTLNVDSIPNAVTTDVIAAGETVFCNVTGVSDTVMTILDQDVTVYYDGVAYGADENGVVSVQLGKENPVQLELVNGSDADTDYSLYFRYPVGHKLNPKLLTDLGDVEAVVKAGTDGFYYSYTTPDTGKLSFRVKTAPETANVLTGVALTNLQSQDTDSLLTAEASEEWVSVEAGAGDEILICVSVTAGGDVCVEGTLTLFGEYISYQEIGLPGFTAEVPAKSVRYFVGYDLGESIFSMDHAADATVLYKDITYLPQDGKLKFLVEGEDGAPFVFAIENHSEEDAAYTVALYYPEGSRKNPTDIVLGTSSMGSQEGASGYWFSYTAPKDGTLCLTFDTEKNWCYAINGGEICYSDAEPAVNEAAVAAHSGEQILIWVNTYDPENPETAPAGEVSFKTSFVSDPVELDLTRDYEAQILSQETAQFTGNLRNAIVTISNAGNLTVVCNGSRIPADEDGVVKITFLEPDSDGQWKFSICNDKSAVQNCSMRFSGLVGSWLNPAELALGNNTVQQEANATDYCFRYTAPKAGTLSLRFDLSTNWCYSINDGEKQYSDAEPAVNQTNIEVAEGDKVEVRVNTYDPAAPDTVPAGTVSFKATLITGPVAIEDPTTDYEASMLAGETVRFTGPFYENATVTVTDAAGFHAVCNGTTYHAAGGVITFPFEQPNEGGQWEFSLYNGSGAEAACTMTFSGPVGSWLNPAELVLNTNTAELAANAKDHYFSYLAPKDGNLVLSFDDTANWYYIVNGGEKQFAGSDPAVNVVTIPVEAEDEVILQVNTCDPEHPETTPAGTVEFTATLVTGPVTVENPAQPTVINLLAGETVIIEGNFGTEKLSIADAADLILAWKNTAYTADEDDVLSLTFSEGEQSFTLCNSAKEDTTATLIFGEESGTASNPAELIIGTNTAVCKAGNKGYYFTFENTTDAAISLKFDFSSVEERWWAYYERTNETVQNAKFRTYYQGLYTSNAFTCKVQPGATLTLIVKICNPATPDEVSAGAVEFKVEKR